MNCLVKHNAKSKGFKIIKLRIVVVLQERMEGESSDSTFVDERKASSSEAVSARVEALIQTKTLNCEDASRQWINESLKHLNLKHNELPVTVNSNVNAFTKFLC
jgi:hypothetical protein